MDDHYRISGASAQASPLARSYRQLLACYPAWYRRIHEEEMLAVLMTGAPQGKRRPGIAEAADLLWGALRIRCQPLRPRGGESDWRDALAVVSVIAPLIIVVSVVISDAQILLFTPAPLRGPLAQGLLPWALRGLAAPLAVAALVPLALRMRRVAALACAGLLILIVSSQHGDLVIGEASMITAIGLQAVALAASAGPRRGLQILRWKYAVVVITAILLACTGVISTALMPRLILLALITAVVALTSSLGRWLLLLLAIPLYPLFVFGAPPFSQGFGWGYGLDFLPFPAVAYVACYLPPAALAVLAVVAARRASSRSARPCGAPDA